MTCLGGAATQPHLPACRLPVLRRASTRTQRAPRACHTHAWQALRRYASLRTTDISLASPSFSYPAFSRTSIPTLAPFYLPLLTCLPSYTYIPHYTIPTTPSACHATTLPACLLFSAAAATRLATTTSPRTGRPGTLVEQTSNVHVLLPHHLASAHHPRLPTRPATHGTRRATPKPACRMRPGVAGGAVQTACAWRFWRNTAPLPTINITCCRACRRYLYWRNINMLRLSFLRCACSAILNARIRAT